jgi:hypothetical protein
MVDDAPQYQSVARPPGLQTMYRALVVDPAGIPSAGTVTADVPTHWTWDLSWAQHFAVELADSNWNAAGEYDTAKDRIILVAEIADDSDIESDPAVLAELKHDFDDPEPELVVRAGTGVNVTSVLVLGLTDEGVSTGWAPQPEQA